MVSWKVVLVIVIIAALAITVGMWFGYRYVSEQEDISPEGQREPSNIDDESLGLTPVLTEVLQKQYRLLYANLYLFQKGESKL